MKPRQQVYDLYWKFATERQKIFFKKIERNSSPYTNDPILGTYKFCNVYRASDRVSQFLIKNVIYKKTAFSDLDIVFRILLFRLLNKIETWEILENKLGEVNLKNFSLDLYSKILEEIKNNGKPIYGNAFILCANKVFGFSEKHKNHLALLEKAFVKGTIGSDLIKSRTLKELFEKLKELPLIGNFMAYQIAIDLNYSEVFSFSENDFTTAGPGALRGIRKCFEDTGGKNNGYIIQYMVENQDKEFNKLELKFKNLWGRPLHAIDCQGLFCEVDKYSRMKFPKLKSNRVRIKAKYKPISQAIEYFYPPKWNITIR